jgi:hypothetical protein
MSIYTEQGYEDRNDYLEEMAYAHDVPLAAVWILADLLGPNEDFDGLVTELENYNDRLQLTGDDS